MQGQKTLGCHRLFANLWNRPYLLLTLAVLFWSGNFIIGRAALSVAPPVAMAFWRWALALIPILWLGRRHLRHDLPVLRANWPIVVVLGVLGISCFNTFVYLGLRETTSINALLLQSVMPLLILLVAYLLFGERPALRQILGVVLSIGGVALIAARGVVADLLALQVNRGDVWVMAAVIAYAFYSALLRLRPAVHPLSLLGATFVIGTVVLLPFYLHEHLSGQVLPLTLPVALTIAYLVIFPSLLSFLFFNRGVELVGAGRAGPFVYLMPVFGSGLAVVFLGERIEGYHLAGAALIALGLAVSSLRRRA